MASKLDIHIVVDVYENENELITEDSHLLKKAREACQNAYAPYSHFCVGAAILLDDGTVILGSNQENDAYPSGLCDERTAIFATGANYPNKTIKKIAVTACPHGYDHYVAANPCGACRQALSEYENKQLSPIEVIMEAGDGKIVVTPSVASLLPLKFSGESLK